MVLNSILVIFSWAGLFDGRYTDDQLQHLVQFDDSYANIRARVNSISMFFIDDISMLSLKDFQQLELVCRTARGKCDQYFGGLQVIGSGDFYQLSPVPNNMYPESGQYCFESEMWNSIFPHHVNLTMVYRHAEQELIRAVGETAVGNISDNTHTKLQSLVNGLLGIVMSAQETCVRVFFPELQQSHNIYPFKFTVYNPQADKTVETRCQIPLRLAFGMTIHKAQGSTLSQVEVDCTGIWQVSCQ